MFYRAYSIFQVTFDWSLKDENDTIDSEAVSNRGSQSTLRLDLLSSVVEGPRTFVCTANNSVGASAPCMLLVQGMKTQRVIYWSIIVIVPNNIIHK